MITMPSADADRLIKFAGMLGSDHDGERANAARMATDLLRRHKLTWSELLAPLVIPAAPPAPTWVCPNTIEEACHLCLRSRLKWTARERKFLQELPGFKNPSEKQLNWLDLLLERAREAAE